MSMCGETCDFVIFLVWKTDLKRGEADTPELGVIGGGSGDARVEVVREVGGGLDEALGLRLRALDVRETAILELDDLDAVLEEGRDLYVGQKGLECSRLVYS